MYKKNIAPLKLIPFAAFCSPIALMDVVVVVVDSATLVAFGFGSESMSQKKTRSIYALRQWFRCVA